MADFLDRHKIIEEIIRIINEAKREIVMIVPYIKISPTIWTELTKTENLNKEILLIYREDSMKETERIKLHSLNNLTIMNHPNVHAKCYLNESLMIICSMNLYEHSEKTNREMGVLLDKDFFDYEAYQDSIKEIRTIINASRLEKKSNHVTTNGFSLKIFEPKEILLKKYLDIINKVFIHKRFELIVLDGNEPEIKCFPYHENLSASIDYLIDENVDENPTLTIRRVAIKFYQPKETTIKIHGIFWKQFPWDKFDQFKIYWDNYKNYLTIYAEWKKYPKWNELDFEQSVKKFRQGLDNMIDYIRIIEKKIK